MDCMLPLARLITCLSCVVCRRPVAWSRCSVAGSSAVLLYVGTVQVPSLPISGHSTLPHGSWPRVVSFSHAVACGPFTALWLCSLCSIGCAISEAPTATWLFFKYHSSTLQHIHSFYFSSHHYVSLFYFHYMTIFHSLLPS